MQFANPIWLWGLTGLLIPVGIHLLSRKEGKIIKIGSIRHLEDTNTAQFKSLRLNEMLLLALRCLLIVLLVFFLSGFHFIGIEKKGPNWLLVEKGLERDQQFIFLIDSLKQNGFELRFLSPGFPRSIDSILGTGNISYWSLLENLKTKSLNQAVVISYNYLKGFRGKRISLPGNFYWISKIPAAIEFPLKTIRHSNDSATLRLGQSDAYRTYFITKPATITPGQHYFKSVGLDSIPVEFPDTISIAVVSDPEFDYDVKLITTALKVAKETSPDIFNIDTSRVDKYSKDQKTDWVVWLSNKPPPHSHTCNTIIYKKNELDGIDLFERNEVYPGGYSSWFLTKRVNEEIALRENLTVQLALTLLPKGKYQNRVQQFDRRVLPEKRMWDTIAASTKPFNASTIASNEKYIAILFLTFLLIERLVAFRRNQ